MKTLTYFNAFKKATERMVQAGNNRGSNFGIAVDGDTWALDYQRYERLAWKLDMRIGSALGEQLDDYCWFCGMSDDIHTHLCPERAEQAQGEGEGE